MVTVDVEKYLNLSDKLFAKKLGRVDKMVGLTVESTGPEAAINDICNIYAKDDEDDEQDIPDTDFYESKSPFYAGDTIRKQTKNIDFNAIITSINTDKKKGEIRITKINESNKNLVIADSYTCDGVTFKVTSVLSNAFLHLKSDSITIGKNVKSIKYGELDYSSISTGKVIIKTKKLKAKNVDRNFVKDLPDFVTIVVPKSKYKEYKKLFFKKGLAKTAKVIKG